MKSRKLLEDFLKPLITVLMNVVPHTGGARDAGMKRFGPTKIWPKDAASSPYYFDQHSFLIRLRLLRSLRVKEGSLLPH